MYKPIKKTVIFIMAIAVSAGACTIPGTGKAPAARQADSAAVNTVVLGGQTVGIKINVQGAMVVGFSDIRSASSGKVNPARNAGIKEGDVITSINGSAVNTTEDISKIMDTYQPQSGTVTVCYRRGGKALECQVTPVVAKNNPADGYKLGAWVRDSASGVGTLTYIDEGKFGALGHAITDGDCQKIIEAGSGEILPAKITGIRRGEKGSPGELKGILQEDESLGTVSSNTEFGIFGELTKGLGGQQIDTADRSRVHLGHAEIYCSLDNGTPKAYNASIVQIAGKFSNNNKGIVIKVTDSSLLEKTGGIVQGMSGSPIVQDGMLVGALTHVFVNDPTRGYGTYIELMQDKMLDNGGN